MNTKLLSMSSPLVFLITGTIVYELGYDSLTAWIYGIAALLAWWGLKYK